MNSTSPFRPRVVVVGVDGSPSSVAALQLAAQLIPLAGDTIHAVTAWQYPLIFGVYTPIEWNYEELAEKALDQALVQAFPKGTPQGLKRQLVHGSPSEVLLEESIHASMLVVGSRGHGGFAELLLGSVSSAVAERAGCPVLIAHGSLPLAEERTTAVPSVEVPA